MANSKLSALAISSPRGTPDRANDIIYVEKAGVSYGGTVNNELGISGNPVGDTDSQTLSNKTLTAPTLTSPMLSGTVTGTYTLGGTPTFPASVVTLTGTQILTNKTLTSPTISSPTITNASITADAITGFTNANNGTIYGIAITSSAFSGTAITSNTIDGSKIKWSSTGANAGIWWEELGRTTLGVAGDVITVSSFGSRKYLKVICNLIATGGTLSASMTFNGDTATNYATRAANNGGADGTAASATSMNLVPSTTAQNYYIENTIVNTTSQEKSVMALTWTTGTAGGANVPERRETVTKWANTVAQITTVAVTNAGTGDYAIGSEVVVLGHD